MESKRLVSVARGLEPADVVLKNAKVFAGFTGEFIQGDLALAEGRIVGVGSFYKGLREYDLQGQYVLPGFIDGHVHIESSMLTPCEFARAVLPQGTTTVIADPHEIANVCGLAGIRYMIEASSDLPLNIFFTASSCVPATHLEDSGAVLGAAELAQLVTHPRVVGLAEMMNMPGVLAGDDEVFAKLELFRGKRIDGHAPGLSGPDLMAYAAAGIESDHEASTLEEAQDRLRAGMHLMIREGSAAHNVIQLLPAVNPYTSQFCFFATDDCHPDDLLTKGGIRNAVRIAIREGLDPHLAIQMATVNTAKYFRLQGHGVIAPRRHADLVVVPDLRELRPRLVLKDGVVVAMDGALTPQTEALCKPYPSHLIEHTVHLAPLTAEDLRLPLRGTRAHVMGLVPHQLLTEHLQQEVPTVPMQAAVATAAAEGATQAGVVAGTGQALLSPSVLTMDATEGYTRYGVADPAQDMLKLAVFERHHATGKHGVCLVQGFGLQKGAIASTIGHDSHNLIVIGADDASMLAAARELAHIQGGVALAVDGKVVGSVALEVAGLMAPRPAGTVAQQIHDLHYVARQLGVRECYDPFVTLAFLSLPVIPYLKLTDKGLVDVVEFKLIDPSCE